jgi:hypothetical protein
MNKIKVKKHITAAGSKKRDPKIYNEYYDLLKSHTSEDAKKVLAEQNDRTISCINKILVKERKKTL